MFSTQWGGEFALDRVVPSHFDSVESVGFMDPADVLRGVHLIPHFSLGKLKNVRSRLVKTDDLWKSYYVNRFVCQFDLRTTSLLNVVSAGLPTVICL